jgi:2'-5' RNA ligase
MAAAPPARLFVAVWPDAAVRAQLAACRDRWCWPAGAKPVDAAKLHLTLHFIGAFARDRIGTLASSLAALPIEPFDLRGGDGEVWNGGIAILRIDGGRALATLHERVGDLLTGFGIALDARPFAPHVTLARKARRAPPPAARCELAWRAAAIALVESAVGAYRVLQTFPAPA